MKTLAELVKSSEDSDITKNRKEICMFHIQRNIEVSKILDYRPMRGYKDQGSLEKIVLAAVIWFVEGFKEGGMMRITDIMKFTHHLLDYKHDSLEDIFLCFQMAEKGQLNDPETGRRIERYAAMTIEILERYWKAYMTYKSELREEIKRSEKHTETAGDYRTEEDTLLVKSERQRQFLADMGQAQRVFAKTERYDFEKKFEEKVKRATGE